MCNETPVFSSFDSKNRVIWKSIHIDPESAEATTENDDENQLTGFPPYDPVDLRYASLPPSLSNVGTFL